MKSILLIFVALIATYCSPRIYPSSQNSNTSNYSVKFAISGNISALRVHTCYAVTVSLTDTSTGNAYTPTSTTSVSITPGTGAYAYDSLDACYAEDTTITQTYLTPSTPTKVIYIKMDTVGSLTLGGASSGFTSGTSTLSSYFTATNASTGPNNPVYASIEDTSLGKYYVAGGFTTWSAYSRVRIARINSDGTIDTTFDPGTGFNADVHALVLQSDGKIIAAGNFTTYQGTSRKYIARINTDGSLDTTFSVGTGFDSSVTCLAQYSDGSIYAGGYFTSFNGTSRNYIAKLTSSGSLDSTFNPGTGFDSYVSAVALQTDGKLVVGGNFLNINGTGRAYVARLNTTGANDGTFNPGTGCSSSVNAIAIQTDGKILLGGFFTTYNGTGRNRIVRASTAGALDGTFNPGTGFDAPVDVLIQQPDGKIIAEGGFSTFNGTSRIGFARLSTTGTIDSTYSPGTGVLGSAIFTFILLSNGKFLAGGGPTSYNGTSVNYIFKTNSDGSLDNTFIPITGLNSYIMTSQIQSDGKPIIGGNFTLYASTSLNNIARLTTDGALDTSFNIGTGFNNIVDNIALQTDGKILAVGNFTTYNGTTRNYIARINTDGSLDTTFNTTGSGLDSEVYSVIYQSTGKILVAGTFGTYNGTSRIGIARLNSDGSLDTSFNPGTGFNSVVYSMAAQTDGKILVCGDFTSYNGTTRNYIARLNTDGSLDTTFAPTGTGFDYDIYNVAIQTDGKIIVVGDFSTYNGTSALRIARLNANGTLDTSFSTGSGLDVVATAVTLQSDGKILVGGQFTTYKGNSRNYIARINTDGSNDTTFDTDTGFDAQVTNISIQSDRRLFVVGIFKAYKNYTASFFTRLTIKGTYD